MEKLQKLLDVMSDNPYHANYAFAKPTASCVVRHHEFLETDPHSWDTIYQQCVSFARINTLDVTRTNTDPEGFAQNLSIKNKKTKGKSYFLYYLPGLIIP